MHFHSGKKKHRPFHHHAHDSARRCSPPHKNAVARPSAHGERFHVRVMRMAPEGEAIAHREDLGRHPSEEQKRKVIFVPHAAPGDLLEVQEISSKSSFTKARITKLIEPGPDRILPPCPLHFDPSRTGPACGGCDWQHLDYPAQLRCKRDIIQDCLRRIAKLPQVELAPTLASPKTWQYRNKVLVPFGPPAGTSQWPIAGFYAAGSHDIVDFNDCPVQPELSTRIILGIKRLAAQFRWSPYDSKSRRGWLRHVLVRTNSAGKAMTALVTRTPEFFKREEFIDLMRTEFPEIIGIHHNVQPLATSVILGSSWRCLWGSPTIKEQIGKFSFDVSPGAFLQVNTAGAQVLYESACQALNKDGRRFDLALDLYCGVGTLSLWIAAHAPRVIGVEENPEAVRDAWKNAKNNRVHNARFLAGRAEAVTQRLLRDGLPQNCAVITDPPRSGLGIPVLKFLTNKAIQRVVYVSCNPATFSRDAAFLTNGCFKLREVQPVDLFPQTSHVELVGIFDRP